MEKLHPMDAMVEVQLVTKSFSFQAQGSARTVSI